MLGSLGWLWLLVSACSDPVSSVTGDVPGLPDMPYGYFVVTPNAYQNGDSDVQIVLSSLSDPCGRSEARDADVAAGVNEAEAFEEHFPTPYWQAALFVRTPDATEDLTERDLSVSLNGSAQDRYEGLVSLLHHHTAYDEGYFAGEGSVLDFVDLGVSNGGALQFDEYKTETLGGSLSTEIVDPFGPGAPRLGDLQMSFHVDWCESRPSR